MRPANITIGIPWLKEFHAFPRWSAGTRGKYGWEALPEGTGWVRACYLAGLLVFLFGFFLFFIESRHDFIQLIFVQHIFSHLENLFLLLFDMML
jgi:hypothetical protein